MNYTAKGDITVTQDIGLASTILMIVQNFEEINKNFVEKCRKLDFFEE